MSLVEELEQRALDLPVRDRALLATHLLASLPLPLPDDDGVAEAERRAAELDANPDLEIGLDELQRRLASRIR